MPVRRALCALIAVFAVTACADPTVELETEQDKLCYGLGQAMGGQFKGQFSEAEVKIITRGMEDALLGRETAVAPEQYLPKLDGFLKDRKKQDVEEVLRDLGLGAKVEEGEVLEVLEVLNKLDLMDADARARLHNQISRGANGNAAVSALTGEGCDALLDAIDRRLGAGREVFDISVDIADGRAISWLYDHGEVVERRDDERFTHLKVRLDEGDRARFEGLRHAPAQ